MKVTSTILLIIAYVICLSVAVFSRPANPWFDFQNELLGNQRQQSNFESQRIHSSIGQSQIPAKRLTALSKCMSHPGPHCRHFFGGGKRSIKASDFQNLRNDLNKEVEVPGLDINNIQFTG